VQPVKSVPQSLLVNRFAVLDVEEINTDICEPIDAPSLSLSAPDRIVQPWRPKWEIRLPKQLSANTLNAHSNGDQRELITDKGENKCKFKKSPRCLIIVC